MVKKKDYSLGFWLGIWSFSIREGGRDWSWKIKEEIYHQRVIRTDKSPYS